MDGQVFETHFADEFDHPRNVVVRIINADELGEAQKALRARKVHFCNLQTPQSMVWQWSTPNKGH